MQEWIDIFTDRQKKEIQFSVLYEDQYGHGTDGHNSKIIIAKMARLLMLVAQGMSLEDVIRQEGAKNDENKPS